MGDFDPSVCSERHSNIERRITSIDSTIHGNGSPGIKTDLIVLQQEVKLLRKAVWASFAAAGASAATGLPNAVNIFKAILAAI
jgi:hypothetical protein